MDADTPKIFASYGDIGLQTIAPAVTIPTVGEKTAEFAGFHADTKYRPLATVSHHNVFDPHGWHAASLSSEEITALRRAFRTKFPNVQNCIGPDDRLQPWRYSDADIHLDHSFTSRSNWKIATVWLESRCDGPDDAGFEAQVLAINPTGGISFVGENLSFLDAGDYDADGRSEVLFLISGYNRGGYALLFDDFKRSAVFEFSYH